MRLNRYVEVEGQENSMGIMGGLCCSVVKFEPFTKCLHKISCMCRIVLLQFNVPVKTDISRPVGDFNIEASTCPGE